MLTQHEEKHIYTFHLVWKKIGWYQKPLPVSSTNQSIIVKQQLLAILDFISKGYLFEKYGNLKITIFNVFRCKVIHRMGAHQGVLDPDFPWKNRSHSKIPWNIFNFSDPNFPPRHPINERLIYPIEYFVFDWESSLNHWQWSSSL